MATATAPAQAQAQQAAPVRAQAFPVGVLQSENPDYDQVKAQTAAAQQFPNYVLEPTGWLRGIEYQFDMSVTGQSTNSVTYKEDQPWSVIQKVTLKDTGNREVFGPLSGYDWFCTNKYGAYWNVGDPRAESVVHEHRGHRGHRRIVLLHPVPSP